MALRIIQRSSHGSIVLLGLVLASCLPTSSVEKDPMVAQRALEPESFQVVLGESHTLADGTRISFLHILADSRCPADVVCVWAGEATIRVGIAAEGEDPISALVTVGGGGRADSTQVPPVVAGGYSIQLLQLDPYPKTHESRSDSIGETDKLRIAHLRVKRP